MTDENRLRLRERVMRALADQEHGRLDAAGLRATLESVYDSLEPAERDFRQALFLSTLDLVRLKSPGSTESESLLLDRVRARLRRVCG